MNAPIQLNQHDAGVKLAFTCVNEKGEPIDLTGLEVDFTLYFDGTAVNEGRTRCMKTDAPMGVAEYTVTGDDTDAAGLLYGKLRLEQGAEYVRNIGSIPLLVEADSG
ncbi:MAG: hypothetical protein GC154_12600 [bacterium]|nr:hypothetical protein [bacterium]